MHANYEAVDGVYLKGDEVLATMADDTVETIGVDESVELHTWANAASVTNEANSPTGINLSGVTAAVVTSPVDHGTWALSAESNTSPTAAARLYLDLNASPISLVVGNVYTLSFAVRHIGSGDQWNCHLGSTNSLDSNYITIETLVNTDTTFATHTVTFKHSANTRYFGCREWSAFNDGGVYFDTLSIKRSGQLVANGGMNAETSGINWTLGTGWTISGGFLTHVGPTGGDANQNDIDILVGVPYVVTYTVSNWTAGSVYVRLGGGAEGITRSANGTYTETIIPTVSILSMHAISIFAGNIDNVSVRLAIPDLSSYGDGLEVHGLLDKIAVNTDATTVGYSNFSADNFAEQPYNANMDFDAGGVTLMAWLKQTGAGQSTQNPVQIGQSSTYSINLMRESSSGDETIQFKVNGAAISTGIVGSSKNMVTGEWVHVALTYINNVFYFYIDGVLNTTDSTNVGALTPSATDVVNIGFGSNTVTGAEIDVAIVKVCPSGLTAAQIKTIYNKEKVLFQKESVFSVVGQSYDLDLDLADSTRGDLISKNTNTSKSGAMETIVHFEKQTWNCPITPFDPLTFRYVRKFLRACSNNQAFTFDERGTTASPDNPFQAYLTSQNHNYPRDNGSDWRSASFSLREK